MSAIGRLVWDPGNIAHIARHQVTPREVEEACHGEHILRMAYGGRIMVIGPTNAGDMIAVVLEPVGDDAHFAITARPASRKERRLYREEKGGS